jgi:hypothetical protein
MLRCKYENDDPKPAERRRTRLSTGRTNGLAELWAAPQGSRPCDVLLGACAGTTSSELAEGLADAYSGR